MAEKKTERANKIQKNKLPNQMLRIIYERRSIRKYKDIAIKRQLIEQILDAGRMAPSAMNKQPWKFHILTEKEDIRMFSKALSKAVVGGIVKLGVSGIIKMARDFLHFPHYGDILKVNDPIFHGAPVVIFISAAKDDEWADLDIGMCAQNMMLAARYLGLDTCPVGMVKYAGNAEIFNRFDLPVTDQVKIAITLGYGDEHPLPAERIKDNARFITAGEKGYNEEGIDKGQ